MAAFRARVGEREIDRAESDRSESGGSESGGTKVELDYRVEPRARFGWGRPPHPQLAARIQRGDAGYSTLLSEFTQHASSLGRIPQGSDAPKDPVWRNSYFEGLDIVALYGLLSRGNPSVYLEIGSGYSTRVARRAVEDQGLQTQIVSLDPNPRASVSSVADEILTDSLEAVDLALFDRLSSDDVVFFDGSHRLFTNSDVTVFFTEVLPRLPPGVLVHVHDIFLPWDYIPNWGDRWYSEQYVLSSWLLAGDRVEILMPNFYVSLHPKLHHLLDRVFDQFIWSGMPTNGSSFWFRVHKTSSISPAKV